MNEEINAKRIMEGLINVLSKRYDILQKLRDWEIKGESNEEEYKKAKEHLHMLTIKEKRLINQIKEDIYVLDECEGYLIYEFQSSPKPEQKLNDILERIEATLNEIGRNIPEIEITFLSETEIIMESYAQNEQTIEKALDEKHLKSLEEKIKSSEDKGEKEELIKYKYRFIFRNKHLDETLEMLDYNPENLLEIDDDLRAELLGKTKEEYRNLKEGIIANTIQELILELASSPQNEEPKKARIIELLKYLSEETMQDLKEFLEYNKIDEATTKIIEEIEKLLKQKGYKKCEETNEDCPKIDENTTENLITLIKLEEQILGEIDSISQENNNQSFRHLEYLLKIESDLISKLNIDYTNQEQILEIIKNELGFFLKDGNEYLIEEIKEIEALQKQIRNAIEDAIQDQTEEVKIQIVEENSYLDEKKLRKEQLIISRLLSKIPELDENQIIPSQTTKSSQQILQNHLLRSLKQYDKLFSKEPSYKKVYYEQYFAAGLTDSLLLTKGYSEDLIIPNNALSAELSNISEIEYSFDKDEQLFEIGEGLIETASILLELDTKTEETKAYLDFLAIRLKDIMQNISDEHKLSLEEYLEETSVPLNLTPNKIKAKQPSKTLTKRPNEAVKKD